MRLPYEWLRELVDVPDDIDAVAKTLGLRGFEVASIERAPHEVIDFEITANRPDCLSVVGLAREAAAAYGWTLAALDTAVPVRGEGPSVAVSIDDAELCPRYCAQVFAVTAAGAWSPEWMRARLEAAGVRSISPIVDVTNYVMLELGHPTHAFDLDRLGGRALRIRRARPGERLRTLDNVDRTLEPDMLVIADAERAQAIGGVMGGADSEIGSQTRFMVLESAYFKPASIRRTSKRLGLKTEASSRFERGADVNAAPLAIGRAATLLQRIGAATPVGPLIDVYPAPREPLTLTLRASRIERVLGMPVPDADVPAILQPLGFVVDAEEPGTDDPRSSTLDPRTRWLVTVPTFRVDVQREVDLIEEIARHDGYLGLPATFPELEAPQDAPDPRTLRDRQIRHLLGATGLSEAMTFAFIERAAAAPFAVGFEPAAIANPLSEKYAVLRPSLMPGLIDASAHNRRREQKDVRLFETGARFTAEGEQRAVAGVWSGAGTPPHWSAATRTVDFFDVKGVVAALCAALRLEDVAFEPVSRPYFVAGRAARVAIRIRNESDLTPVVPLGELGQIAPAVLEARGFPATEELYAFELNVDAITAAQPPGDLRAESLPRFPSVSRDLSILVDITLPAAAVRGTIRAAAPSTLVQLVEFDRYRGQGIPDDKVSLSFRLTFRSADRTLTDAEVDDAMQRVVAELAAAHRALRR